MDVKLDRNGSNSATVRIGPLSVAFSYETPVAFHLFETGWVVSENVWSRTTGKHINQAVPMSAPRIPHEQFEERLKQALSGLVFRDG